MRTKSRNDIQTVLIYQSFMLRNVLHDTLKWTKGLRRIAVGLV